MLAANQSDTRRRIEIATNVRIPWYREDSDPNPENPENWNPEEPHVGPWQDFGDWLLRFIYAP